MILVEEPENVEPIAKAPSPIVEPVAHSLIVETKVADAEIVGKASEPEPNEEEMVVKDSIPEPKLKRRILKKMTIKKTIEKSKKVKKTVEPKEVKKAPAEGEIQNEESFNDSLMLTKVIDAVVQDIMSILCSPPAQCLM